MNLNEGFLFYLIVGYRMTEVALVSAFTFLAAVAGFTFLALEHARNTVQLTHDAQICRNSNQNDFSWATNHPPINLIIRIPFSTIRIPFSTIRIPYSTIRIPYSTIRIPYSIIRIPYSTIRIPF